MCTWKAFFWMYDSRTNVTPFLFTFVLFVLDFVMFFFLFAEKTTWTIHCAHTRRYFNFFIHSIEHVPGCTWATFAVFNCLFSLYGLRSFHMKMVDALQCGHAPHKSFSRADGFRCSKCGMKRISFCVNMQSQCKVDFLAHWFGLNSLAIYFFVVVVVVAAVISVVLFAVFVGFVLSE